MRGRAFVTCRIKGDNMLETQQNLGEITDEIKKMGYAVRHRPTNLVYVIGGIDWNTVDRVNELAKVFNAEMGSIPSNINVSSVVIKTKGKTEDLVRSLHRELVEKA